MRWPARPCRPNDLTSRNGIVHTPVTSSPPAVAGDAPRYTTMSVKPPPDHLLALAADLRAGGAPWDAVADKVGRAAETVRRWPAVYPAAWSAAARAAEQRLLAEATAESVLTLRKQLRSEDEKAGRDAARSLIQFRVATSKKARRATGSPVRPTTDATRIAAYLEGMTDAQIDAIVEELRTAGPRPVGERGPGSTNP